MQTKTLAQNYNGEFNWHHALDNPDDYPKAELTLRSSSWVLCACGNLCDIIPRTPVVPMHDHYGNPCMGEMPVYGGGEPVDHALKLLGFKFYDYVQHENWHHAKIILARIEERSQFLINDILSQRYVELPLLTLTLL